MNGLKWLNRNPTLCKGKRFHLVYFGLISALASSTGFLLFFYYLSAKGARITPLLAPCIMVSIWFSGRIGHLVVVRRKESWNETGFYSQAAILGSLLFIGVGSRLFHFPYLIVVDGICFALPLTLAIARLGCYNYGCCYGKQTSVPWAVRYFHPDSKVLRIDPTLSGKGLHPVPLYASCANLIAFLVIASQINRGLPEGAIVTFLQFFYALKRALLDRYRNTYEGGRPRFFISAYTLAMLIVACGFLLFGIHPAVPLNALLNMRGFLYFLLKAPSVIGSIVLAALLTFIGYGYHGKKLGTFVYAPKY